MQLSGGYNAPKSMVRVMIPIFRICSEDMAHIYQNIGNFDFCDGIES